MSGELTVSPPLIDECEVVPRTLCGPGPSDYWPSVVEALTRPVLTFSTDEYFKVVDDIRNCLKYVFQTQSDLVLAMSGAGHTGMEAVICNLLGPGETLLIAGRGIWDDRACEMAKRYGIKTVVTKVPPHTTFVEQDLEPMLRRIRPAALFITHGDSSTGTIQDLSWVGKLCQKYGALLLVDTVVSIGGAPFLMDAWAVDAVYTSSQKALSGPAGISPIAFSKLAERKIQTRKHDPPFYFDIKMLSKQWNCYGDTRFYHHTMSPPLMWALRASLMELCKETLPASWARHRRVMLHFHKRLSEMPVQFYVPDPMHRLPTITTISLPEGYDAVKFAKYMANELKVVIMAGLGPTAPGGRVLRVGLMGANACEEVADRVVQAMADTLSAMRRSKL
ncbi:Serine--pyruvate aminotransferase, mitochondrial [Eumeta japonica]|uniref:Alanine--glyoxylate aminotransferase n=1 Tax=Eumeta variegata TaxID=151549 RepID=A0A4C1UA36_EUMVA|nr:Serine--pyruvate aminotransferase, mitochondrial [Eumeta japonica]